MTAPSPVRVLHLIGAGQPGGAETFAVRLMRALQQHPDVAQQVLCKRGSWVAARLAAAGVPHETAPFGGGLDGLLPWGTHRRARRVAEAFKPDVVLAWMNRGARFVPQGPWATAARLGGFYNLKNYRGRVTHLIGNTPEIVAYCKQGGWPAAQVQLLHNFIPAPPAGWERHRAAQRAAWGWGAADFGLVQVGRLHPVKGCDVALRALAALPDRCKLALVGTGPMAEALKALAAELGVGARVTFAGWADPVSPLVAAADAWLVPSRHEPLGNTAIEAWAHGIPLIVSRVGGLATMVTDAKTGLLVPPEDPNALAAAVTRLAAAPELGAALVQAGQQAWQQTYAEGPAVAAYVRLLGQLAAGGVAPRES